MILISLADMKGCCCGLLDASTKPCMAVCLASHFLGVRHTSSGVLQPQQWLVSS